MAAGTWMLEGCANERFPYRLQVLNGDRPWLTLRVQDRRPAAGRNIFYLREKEPPEPGEVLEEIERLSVVAMQRRGLRASIVLDRARYKRCDFLFLSRPYKGRPGETYEQIFWQPHASMRQHRPRANLVSALKQQPLTVRIAHDERYPWQFPGCDTRRGRLPSGDHALVDGGELLALVERETMDNLLGDFGVMPILHQRLMELASHRHYALVIEAPYEDFLDVRKAHHYGPAFCSAAIADLHAAHPALHIIFCANRKMANEWARNYFAAVWRRLKGPG